MAAAFARMRNMELIHALARWSRSSEERDEKLRANATDTYKPLHETPDADAPPFLEGGTSAAEGPRPRLVKRYIVMSLSAKVVAKEV